MANLTSVLGTDLISNAPSILNGNFQNLNVSLNSTSVLASGASSLLSSKIQIFSTVNPSILITTAATDKLMVWANGNIGGSTAAGSVALVYNGVVKNAIEIKQAAAADMTSFALMYTETPGAGTNMITASVIANGALTIKVPTILVQTIT